MIQIEKVQSGGHVMQGVRILSPGGEGHPNLLVLLCDRGYLMCGYLNTGTAESVGDAAAVISGSSFAEMLANPVKAVTAGAASLGVTVGMTGAEAAAKLASCEA